MRSVTIYTSDSEYVNFIQLAKSLRYVEKIEIHKNVENSIDFMENWQTSKEIIQTLEVALKQDKSTFKTRDELQKKYKL